MPSTNKPNVDYTVQIITDDKTSAPMPLGTFEKAADAIAAAAFSLEPSDPGVIPERVIDELRRAHREAKDYAQALGDAIKAQAEKHKIRPAALRRFVAALEGDKIDDAEAEARDLERLIQRVAE